MNIITIFPPSHIQNFIVNLTDFHLWFGLGFFLYYNHPLLVLLETRTWEGCHSGGEGGREGDVGVSGLVGVTVGEGG